MKQQNEHRKDRGKIKTGYRKNNKQQEKTVKMLWFSSN